VKIRLLPRLPIKRTLRSRWFPWLLALVFLTASLINWALLRGEQREDSERTQVENVTRDFLRALTNFGAETIGKDVAKIKSFAVGDFQQEVRDTFSQDQLRQLRENKVESVGKVESVFTEQLAGETATVFAVVQETVDNKTSEGPRTNLLRIEVQLIDTDAGWKISKVDILPSSGTLPTGG
jgi:hypothetical protein